MLSNFRRVAAECGESLRSRALLEQMLSFQFDDNGKPQAVQGEHDDLVMAAAICHMVRDQQDVEASMQGSLFDLPAGRLKFFLR